MRYFNIEGTFIENISVSENEFNKAIADHLAYLQKGFDEGFILYSGPKENEGGGFILVKGQSLQEIEDYIANDPLKILNIQSYKITEFKLYKCQDLVEKWFD